MKIPAKAIVLALSFVAILGAVYWLGSALKGSLDGVQAVAAGNGVSGEASSAVPAGRDASVAIPTVQSSPQENETPLPEKVQLNEQERQFILTEFFRAAEKNVKSLQADISRAKAEGMALTDIAVKEEKLRQMQLVLQQVRARNPGF